MATITRIEGDRIGRSAKFIVIHTSDYNADGHYVVQSADINGLKELGFDRDDLKLVNDLREVGSIIGQNGELGYKGLYVMRIA